MKRLLPLTLALIVAGCTGAHKYSKFDEFEGLRVDQMTGNVVSGRIFGKTSLCLGARRESQVVTAVTNIYVTSVTNNEVTYQTNATISALTNILISASTNAVAAPLIESTNIAVLGDSQPAVVLANAASPGSTNVSMATSGNHGVTRGNNQTTITSQVTSQYNNQISASSNNTTITTQFSRNLTSETNMVITVITNQSIQPITNIAILSTNQIVRHYYLLVELLPPPDFTLQTGDSLMLLVDGRSYSFTPANPESVFSARKGYVSVFYRATPEVLLGVANAREVRIRLKGVNNHIDRTMPRSAQANFRKFLQRNFNNSQLAAPAGKPASMTVTSL